MIDAVEREKIICDARAAERDAIIDVLISEAECLRGLATSAGDSNMSPRMRETLNTQCSTVGHIINILRRMPNESTPRRNHE